MYYDRKEIKRLNREYRKLRKANRLQRRKRTNREDRKYRLADPRTLAAKTQTLAMVHCGDGAIALSWDSIRNMFKQPVKINAL